MSKMFATEADLVAEFCRLIGRRKEDPWTAYHETAGFDLLLVSAKGIQIGIEAKLSLNAKVLEQSLPGYDSGLRGPDYRAVLVPKDGLQQHMRSIALHLGLTIMTVWPEEHSRYSYLHGNHSPDLPNESWSWGAEGWARWCPAQRCKLPDYIPDVTGGHAAPVQLTDWKIKAIKLMILLERFGSVTRADMKALQISPSRWTDCYHGFLSPGDGGYVRNSSTPDLKTQHPVNWAQIAADFPVWSKQIPGRLGLVA